MAVFVSCLFPLVPPKFERKDESKKTFVVSTEIDEEIVLKHIFCWRFP